MTAITFTQELIDTSDKEIITCYYLSPFDFEIINKKDIDKLDISYNYMYSDVYLNNKSITSLNISRCNITDEYIKACNLPNLKTLDISGNSIGPEGCKYLSTLPNLTDLNISSNARIEREGLGNLCDSLSITHLDVSQTLFSPEDNKDLGNLYKNKHISTLNVSYNVLTRNDIYEISKMPYLCHLIKRTSGINEFNNSIFLDINSYRKSEMFFK
jgi:Leucine-rich repeat (LRR) protein